MIAVDLESEKTAKDSARKVGFREKNEKNLFYIGNHSTNNTDGYRLNDTTNFFNGHNR
jgi:hypothetical protein